RRYECPFPVIGRVGKEDPGRWVSKRAPTTVVTLYDRGIEEMSDHMIQTRGVPRYKEYLIKWRDLPDSEAMGEDVMPRPILRGYSEFQIVLHLTKRLSEILWKVQEGLGRSWKPLEDLGSLWKILGALRLS
ncbi:hypothetical protein Tco_1566478, partial [Tanacetum coccineum]